MLTSDAAAYHRLDVFSLCIWLLIAMVMLWSRCFCSAAQLETFGDGGVSGEAVLAAIISGANILSLFSSVLLI